jgi:hypothetical protein
LKEQRVEGALTLRRRLHIILIFQKLVLPARAAKRSATKNERKTDKPE